MHSAPNKPDLDKIVQNIKQPDTLDAGQPAHIVGGAHRNCFPNSVRLQLEDKNTSILLDIVGEHRCDYRDEYIAAATDILNSRNIQIPSFSPQKMDDNKGVKTRSWIRRFAASIFMLSVWLFVWLFFSGVILVNLYPVLRSFFVNTIQAFGVEDINVIAQTVGVAMGLIHLMSMLVLFYGFYVVVKKYGRRCD